MWKDLLPGEELIEGPQKKNGMNDVAANDSRMKNYGEKEIFSPLNRMVLQATDARQPVAFVSKTLFQGNKVVASRRGSCIRNERSDETADLKEVDGVFPLKWSSSNLRRSPRVNMISRGSASK